MRDFISAISRSKAWIQDIVPVTLPELGGGFGCSQILVLSRPEIVLVCIVMPKL
jgi:hypothetical protein